MCIVFSIIGRVYWCLRVTSLSMFVDGSSYVSFSRPSIFCILFVVYFESEMSDLSLRSSVSLSFPSLHSLTMWLHFMLDSSGSSLLFVFFVSPSFSFFAFESSISFHPVSFSYSDPFLGLLVSLHHHYTSHYQFDFLHCLVIIIIFTLGTLGSMAYEIFYTCCNLIPRAWVFYH